MSEEKKSLNLEIPLEALTFLKLVLESESVTLNGKQFALCNKSLLTLHKELTLEKADGLGNSNIVEPEI